MCGRDKEQLFAPWLDPERHNELPKRQTEAILYQSSEPDSGAGSEEDRGCDSLGLISSCAVAFIVVEGGLAARLELFGRRGAVSPNLGRQKLVRELGCRGANDWI